MQYDNEKDYANGVKINHMFDSESILFTLQCYYLPDKDTRSFIYPDASAETNYYEAKKHTEEL